MTDGAPIVVLEDERAVALLIRRVLESAGVVCPLEFFSDGDAARSYLRDRAQKRLAPPALVLLDMHVAGCSGLDVLDALRALPRLASVPAIVLSGSGGEREMELAERHGATAYLVKPAGVLGLVDAIRELGLHELMRSDP